MKKNYFSLRTVLGLFLFISLAFALAAGGNREKTSRIAAPSTGYPISVSDDLGNQFVLGSKPQRIVSVTLMTDEILLNMVNPQNLAGISTLSVDPVISNVPERAKQIATKVTLNVEVILALEPDLVFVANWSDAAKTKQLREAGINVYAIQTPTTINGIQGNIRKLGKLVGEEEAALALISQMDKVLTMVKKKVGAIPEDKKLTVMEYSPFGNSGGKGSSWDTIVGLAGLKNGVADYKTDNWGYVPVSKELLIALDPDILVVPGWIYNDPEGPAKFKRSILDDPALQGMKAVKDNQVIQIKESYKSCTSQYIVYAVEALAKKAYPGLF